MLSNVIAVDYESMKVSSTSKHGALLLFDFKAAFPSVVLKLVGMPKGAINFVRALYCRNKCIIACNGGLFNGFELTAGIRQGCPLSPLLFVVSLNILLRRLRRIAPGALTRAFADDTAMVIDDLFKLAPPVHNAFQQFGALSRMTLNIPKTVIVPLWPQPIAEIRDTISRTLPEWHGVDVSTTGRYLGFATGPGKGTSSWSKATRKYEERVGLWASQRLGLQYSAMTYNIFSLSVLSYVSQLENPSEETLKAEASPCQNRRRTSEVGISRRPLAFERVLRPGALFQIYTYCCLGGAGSDSDARRPSVPSRRPCQPPESSPRPSQHCRVHGKKASMVSVVFGLSCMCLGCGGAAARPHWYPIKLYHRRFGWSIQIKEGASRLERFTSWFAEVYREIDYGTILPRC